MDLENFERLRDNYALHVANRAGLVRLSLSAAGSRYLTEQIRLATANAERAKAELTAFVEL
jgi:hypothetical protein